MPPVTPCDSLASRSRSIIPTSFTRPSSTASALAHVRGHRCELVSRNGHTFKQWPQLAEEIAHAVRAFSCVLDGEIWPQVAQVSSDLSERLRNHRLERVPIEAIVGSPQLVPWT